MKRVVVFVYLLLMALMAGAQNVEQLVQAYRQGVLNETQIEQIKRAYQRGETVSVMQTEEPSRRRDVDKRVEADTLLRDTAVSLIVADKVGRRVVAGEKCEIFGHDIFRGGV